MILSIASNVYMAVLDVVSRSGGGDRKRGNKEAEINKHLENTRCVVGVPEKWLGCCAESFESFTAAI